MRILLVEDDPKLSSFVKIGLECAGSQVDNVFDSTMAEEMVASKDYDVLIFDVLIPGISGFELCRKVRSKNITTPIILLTGLDTIEDVITGFDCGADDYLIKPFSFAELSARIKNLKEENHKDRVIKVLDLEVDIAQMNVRRNNREVFLTTIEFKILNLFISNMNKVLSSAYFVQKIFGSFALGTNVIDVHINSLRNKIDKDFEPKLIHTKNDMGYYMSIDPGILKSNIPLLS